MALLIFLGLIIHIIHQRRKQRQITEEAYEALTQAIHNGYCDNNIGECEDTARSDHIGNDCKPVEMPH